MKASIGICKLCGLERKLMQAHIIPKCFQKPVKDQKNDMLIVNLSNKTISRVQDFLFDKEVLCLECDQSFSADENYTSTFLDKIRSGELSAVDVKPVRGGLDKLYKADQQKIKRCLLSILWRMSISKKEYFSTVDLGPLENELKSRLNKENLMSPTFIPLSIVSLKNTINWKSRILCADSPNTRFLGSRMYTLHLPNFLVIYHASKKVLFNPQGLSLRNNGLINVGEEIGGRVDEYLDLYYRSFPN